MNYLIQPFQLPVGCYQCILYIPKKCEALTNQGVCPESLRADPIAEHWSISRALTLNNMIIMSVLSYQIFFTTNREKKCMH